MGLMEKRHWQAALAAMVLCGVAMPGYGRNRYAGSGQYGRYDCFW